MCVVVLTHILSKMNITLQNLEAAVSDLNADIKQIMCISNNVSLNSFSSNISGQSQFHFPVKQQGIWHLRNISSTRRYEGQICKITDFLQSIYILDGQGDQVYGRQLKDVKEIFLAHIMGPESSINFTSPVISYKWRRSNLDSTKVWDRNGFL